MAIKANMTYFNLEKRSQDMVMFTIIVVVNQLSQLTEIRTIVSTIDDVDDKM